MGAPKTTNMYIFAQRGTGFFSAIVRGVSAAESVVGPRCRKLPILERRSAREYQGTVKVCETTT